MVVYVISKNGKPLMPTTPARARKKLKQNKAKVVSKTPFTIKLTYDSKEFTSPLILGLDTGSKTIGSAVVSEKGEVVYLSEIEVRNDITDKMKQRAKYRRNRRNLKTRYRKPRWLNRTNSIKKDRFSPTMTSKINIHLKEIKFVKSILPITDIVLETGTFDPHALKNPEVLKNKELYQKGVNYGYANTKAYVLARDGYVCCHCKGKSKNKKLEVHHVIFRCNNGSDDEGNLKIFCEDCHDALHDGKIVLKGGTKKGTLNHATQMNSIRVQLLKQVDCTETFGFITKEHRQLLNLQKTHYVDAAVIASGGNELNFKTNTIIFKNCVSKGDYQQTKGIRSEQRIPTGKIDGFRKFDKVLYLGKEYFIKGRMSTGYSILMDVHGVKQTLKPIPKFSKMKRIGSRKSWIIQEEIILNIA